MKILAHIKTEPVDATRLRVETRYVSPRVRKHLPYKAKNGVTIHSDPKMHSFVAHTPQGLVLNLEGERYLGLGGVRKPITSLVPCAETAIRDIKVAIRELRTNTR